MFTGIVRELGTVVRIDGGEGGIRIEIDAPETASDVAVGDSVALAGVCLTVVTVNGRRLSFDAVPETLGRTALGRLAAGDAVNLEPALRAGEPLGGHIVQGHVDGVGEVRSVEQESEGRRVWIDAPAELLRYCVEKGSIALDGVSLTVNEVEGSRFGVNVIPHTRQVTTLGSLRPGDRVNFEIDMLARYVARLAEFK